MSQYNLKKITPVPRGKAIVDIVLSMTQRKTPTVIHKQYGIGRNRRFYCTKIKFAQQAFHDRLTTIITEFPKLDDIHPFYADLINVEVDKDHYKVALSDLNSARHLIDNMARQYVTFMKYADSPFRCKRLKIAALGRFVKLIKQKAEAFTFLEEVRQKLARMPSIDPNAPTVLLCGCPNVGKTSFLNKSTRAFGEVQPYAFTTQSLFLGHLEYEGLKYQVIDSPGLLERPLEERNTIEMKSITALAHLRACILFIMDISEASGYSLEKQVALFNDLKPIFANKPVVIALNKVDIRKRCDLAQDDQEMLNKLEAENGTIMEMSTHKDDKDGITDVKIKACKDITAYRVNRKMVTGGASKIENRLHVAMPVKRVDKERPPVIPIQVVEAAKRRQLERELELETGDDYYLDLHKNYLLKHEEEKDDIIPEIWMGKNVADFVSDGSKQGLESLLTDEILRQEMGIYGPSSSEDEEDRDIRIKASIVRKKKKLAVLESREKRRVQVPQVPRTALKINTKKVEKSMKNLGVDVDMNQETHFGRSRSKSAVRTETRKRKREESNTSRVRSSSRPPRDQSGVRDEKMAKKAKKLANIAQRKPNLNARKGEGDRRILTAKPKHLFSGKRKMGKTDRR